MGTTEMARRGRLLLALLLGLAAVAVVAEDPPASGAGSDDDSGDEDGAMAVDPDDEAEEDCSEMDDEFEVYWNRIMYKSQNIALKPHVDNIFRRLSWMDNRKKVVTKRTHSAVADGRGY